MEERTLKTSLLMMSIVLLAPPLRGLIDCLLLTTELMFSKGKESITTDNLFGVSADRRGTAVNLKSQLAKNDSQPEFGIFESFI